MVWHGDDPAMRQGILDPAGAVSVYGKVKIPTGRKRYNSRGYAGFGDLDPPNVRLYQLNNGELSVEDLDDEELSYGITKCSDGKFSIRAAYDASRIPRSTRNKMLAELRNRTEAKMGSYVLGAIDRLGQIATRPNSDDKDALKAIDMLLSRVVGKVPDRVLHSQDKPFEVLLERIERTTRADSRRVRELPVDDIQLDEIADGVEIEYEDAGDGVYVPTGDAPINAIAPAPTHINRTRR